MFPLLSDLIFSRSESWSRPFLNDSIIVELSASPEASLYALNNSPESILYPSSLRIFSKIALGSLLSHTLVSFLFSVSVIISSSLSMFESSLTVMSLSSVTSILSGTSSFAFLLQG